MVTKKQLDQLKNQLLQQTNMRKGNNNTDHRKELLDKLNNYSQNRMKLCYDEEVADLEKTIEETKNHSGKYWETRREIFECLLEMIKESDKQGYDQQIKKHNQKIEAKN